MPCLKSAKQSGRVNLRQLPDRPLNNPHCGSGAGFGGVSKPTNRRTASPDSGCESSLPLGSRGWFDKPVYQHIQVVTTLERGRSMKALEEG